MNVGDSREGPRRVICESQTGKQQARLCGGRLREEMDDVHLYRQWVDFGCYWDLQMCFLGTRYEKIFNWRRMGPA